jgi:pimeloyl-ACP methyl ester carboxylesterase
VAAEVRFELGRLTVIENRSSASKRLIEISFVRLRSTSRTPASPIIFLAGGPGVPGIGMGRIPPFFRLFDRLRDIGDVILLDQRGTGMSRPALDCPATTSAPLDALGSTKNAVMYLMTVNRNCIDHWRAEGADVSAYTARDVADDLEDLRVAIGASKISLLAMSYGTRIALVTMQRHPKALDRVVLAGVVGSDNALSLPATWDAQIEKLSRLAGSDFTATATRVLDSVEKKTLELTVNDHRLQKPVTVRVGRIALQTILQGIGDERFAPAIMELFSAISKGDSAALTKRVEGLYNGISSTAIFPVATSCADGASSQRRARVAEQAAGSLAGDINLQMRPEVCRLFFSSDRGPDALPRLMTTPSLLLSGTLDPVAPPFQAEEVRWHMSEATHLVIENAFHGMLPSADVQSVVHDFLKGDDVRDRTLRFARPQIAAHQ